MKTDTTSFISNEYRPSGIILQDPRNMHLDDIRKVLQHCYRLQVKSGPESAFRFAVFVGPKRKRIIANYPEAFNPQSKESEPNHRKKKNKGKQREDPLQGLLQIDELVKPRAAEDIANPELREPQRIGVRTYPNQGHHHIKMVWLELIWGRCYSCRTWDMKYWVQSMVRTKDIPNMRFQRQCLKR